MLLVASILSGLAQIFLVWYFWDVRIPTLRDILVWSATIALIVPLMVAAILYRGQSQTHD